MRIAILRRINQRFPNNCAKKPIHGQISLAACASCATVRFTASTNGKKQRCATASANRPASLLSMNPILCRCRRCWNGPSSGCRLRDNPRPARYRRSATRSRYPAEGRAGSGLAQEPVRACPAVRHSRIWGQAREQGLGIAVWPVRSLLGRV